MTCAWCGTKDVHDKVEVEDMVNNPSHYTSGGIETIDFIKAKLSPEEYKGFLKGTAMRYLSRGGKKWNEEEDYAKAEWYIDKLVKEAYES